MTPSKWLFEMRDIWLTKSPEKIANLLSEELEYYETPLSPPLITIKDVVEAWAEIKNQDIEYVVIDILHEDKNICFATWRFKEKCQSEHVGAYFLRLDEQGKCVCFRQWWNCKDKEA